MSAVRIAESHEWIKVENGKGKVGITNHAQEELGDVVFVELPEVGKELEKGDSFGVVESVKVASDLYIPCSGKITKINEALKENPEFVNEDPFEEGWMVEIELSNKEELNELMDEEGYEKTIS